MAGRVAIVGPGRVGTALARRWAESGLAIAGFVGRDRASARRATRFARAGRILDLAGLRDVATVLVAVGDDDLAEVARGAAAAGAVRPGSLWLHASGFHDLRPLAPLVRRGARAGSLHPLCPFPTAARGYAALSGKVAVLQGEPRARLAALARAAGMPPLAFGRGDRRLYHAACALAANGLTALADLCAVAFARALRGGRGGGRAALHLELMQA